MYMNFEEFCFIVFSVISAILIMKLTGLIFKGIRTGLVKIGARVLRAEMNEIEIKKAVEKALKEQEK